MVDKSPARGSSSPADRGLGLEMYKEAFSEGKRLVDAQLDEMSSMRQRAVQFLAFVGSATAFLVGSSLSATRATATATQGAGAPPSRDAMFFVLAWGATGVTVLAIAALLLLLVGIEWKKGLRRINWRFRMNARTLVRGWIEPDLGKKAEAAFFRDLALHSEEMAAANERSLSHMRRWYRAFLALGLLQVSLWAMTVWMYA